MIEMKVSVVVVEADVGVETPVMTVMTAASRVLG